MTLDPSTSNSDADAAAVVDESARDAGNTSTTAASELTPSPGDTAASPAADTGESPKSLLDAIKKVVKDDGASPAPTTEAKPEPKPGEPSAKADEAPGAVKDDDKPPPFHEHPRWKAVIGERDGLKRTVAELTPDADSFRQVRGFMETNRLSPDEVKQGFAIMAALRNDPAKAWELLQPTVRDLGVFLGHELPADLKAKVEDGSVDEATAQETARLRNQSNFVQNRANADAQRNVQQTANTAAAAVGAKVDEWVGGKAGSDPDFKRIEPLLAGAVLQKQREWTAQGKAFNTAGRAVMLTAEAYDAVRGHLGASRPQRQEIKPIPAGSSTSTAATARPKNMLDVVRQAVAGTYSG